MAGFAGGLSPSRMTRKGCVVPTTHPGIKTASPSAATDWIIDANADQLLAAPIFFRISAKDGSKMWTVDPAVLSAMIDAILAFYDLAKKNIPPGAAYWEAQADAVAHATLRYGNPDGTGGIPLDDKPSMSALSEPEARRREARRKALEELKEYDLEVQRHIREIEARRID